jgi:hypothetical protein
MRGRTTISVRRAPRANRGMVCGPLSSDRLRDRGARHVKVEALPLAHESSSPSCDPHPQALSALRTYIICLVNFSRIKAYLDIGGNIGLTTIPIARNAKMKCLVFEQHPTNFGNLLDNLNGNCIHRDYECHQVAFQQAYQD